VLTAIELEIAASIINGKMKPIFVDVELNVESVTKEFHIARSAVASNLFLGSSFYNTVPIRRRQKNILRAALEVR
jgi:hypothetical protein